MNIIQTTYKKNNNDVMINIFNMYIFFFFLIFFKNIFKISNTSKNNNAQ